MMISERMLFSITRGIFIFMGLVVGWHLFAPEDMKILTEMGKKIWAIAGLSLYIVILIEKNRRDREEEEE